MFLDIRLVTKPLTPEMLDQFSDSLERAKNPQSRFGSLVIPEEVVDLRPLISGKEYRNWLQDEVASFTSAAKISANLNVNANDSTADDIAKASECLDVWSGRLGHQITAAIEVLVRFNAIPP
jgi:hypothetical protein